MLTGRGDKVLYKQAKYTLEKEIRVAKRNYSEKIRIQFSSSDSASVLILAGNFDLVLNNIVLK